MSESVEFTACTFADIFSVHCEGCFEPFPTQDECNRHRFSCHAVKTRIAERVIIRQRADDIKKRLRAQGGTDYDMSRTCLEEGCYCGKCGEHTDDSEDCDACTSGMIESAIERVK